MHKSINNKYFCAMAKTKTKKELDEIKAKTAIKKNNIVSK